MERLDALTSVLDLTLGSAAGKSHLNSLQSAWEAPQVNSPPPYPEVTKTLRRPLAIATT